MGAPDLWAWLPTNDGIYSAKSGYFEAYNDAKIPEEAPDLCTNETFNWKANIWSLKTSPKTKLLLWKAAQNALPVGQNLLHRQVNDSVKCPHCQADESVEHLFFSCPFAKKIWSLAPMKTPLNLAGTPSIHDGILLANKLICLPPTGIGEGPLAPWIFWTIWTSRNQLIFSKKQITEEEALNIALIRAKEWQAAQSTHHLQKPVRHPPPKLPPSPNCLTCFTDASWKADGKSGLGWIFKDPQDRTVVEGSASSSSVGSPLIVEAMATLAAVGVAVESDFKTLFFASDSLILVKALNQKIQQKELHGILHDILYLSSIFNVCSFNFIPRSLNRRADLLAKEALQLSACNVF